MKKILSVVIALAMLLSVCVISSVPVSAAATNGTVAENDEFIISTRREDQFLDDEDDALSRPGGVYTANGFEINPLGDEYADYKVTWPNNTPYVTVQTLRNLKDGFYMEVRIDEFIHWREEVKDTAAEPRDFYTDTWYAFHVWDSVGAQPGQVGTDSEGRDFGHGMEALIRTNWNTNFKNMDNTQLLSDLAYVEWYDDTEMAKPGRYGLGSNKENMTKTTDEKGRLYLTFEIKYDVDEDLYTPYVNGVAPNLDAQGKDVVSENLTALIQGYCDNADPELANMFAYVGFSVQTFRGNAPCSFTITKIGTTKDDAIAPIGDENISAVQRDNAVADITPRDPDADEAEPAFVFTGDRNSYKLHKDNSGSADIVNTADGTLKITSHSGGANPIIRISNDESYDLRDYPIQAMILKNFCTCEWTDLDGDNIPDPYCSHREVIKGHYLAGTNTNGSFAINTAVKVVSLTATDDAGNTYTVFLFDYTDAISSEGNPEVEQRIHGCFNSFDGKINMTTAGRNEFELVATAFLHSVTGASTWAESYLTDELGLTISGGTVDTDKETSDNTEPTDITETSDNTEPTDATEETDTTESESKKPAQTTDKEPGTNKPTDVNVNVNAGCSGVAGFGALAIVAVAAVGLISFKKKEN